MTWDALLFTCDAHSMYNNIDTDHAIEVITWWLDDLHARGELPPNFPLDAVKTAMVMIMKNNIFEWGDLNFLQLLGTAMGTSAAVMWATLYYAYHEVHRLIPKYNNKLLYFVRFIDDIFGVWTGNLTTDWKEFCDDVNDFGVLTWDIEDQLPTTSVNFLDLTLTIEGERITSKTFQKKMNLYLYLPATSAHPPGCIKGTIYGLIRRYHAHNTYRHDYVSFVGLLYSRLLERGWSREVLRPLFLAATTAVEKKRPTELPTTTPTANSTKDAKLLFIHLQYHPDDISRQRIQQLYQEHCGEIFEHELEIERPTIAYSRAPNIADYVTQAKLHEAPGRSASICMGEFKKGLDP